jgi:hypothetical protein
VALYARDVDRSLLERNRKISPEQRLVQLMELQRFAAELQRAGRGARNAR